jgi:hypothetical protein
MNVGKTLRVHRVEPVEDPVPRKRRGERKPEKKPAVPSAAAKAPRAV